MTGLRPGKRLRGEDVTREFFGPHPETGSYLKITLASGKPLKSRGWPWIQTGLRGILGGDKVDKASFLRDGSLLVKTKDCSQTEKLIASTQFLNEPCEIVRDPKLNTSKGTLHAFDLLDLSEDDIVHWFGEFGVVGAKRFTRRVDGKTEPTPTVLLTFDMPSCPSHIKLDYVTYNIKKYIPNPLLCFHCGQFGHPELRCKNPKRCLTCGEAAHEGDCSRKCLSCGDKGHSCRSRDCPRWQKEKEICKLKVEFEISYAEARRKYEASYQPPLLQSYAEVVRKPSDKPGESDLRDKVGKLEQKIDEMTGLLAKMAQQLKLSVAPDSDTQVGRGDTGHPSGSAGGGEDSAAIPRTEVNISAPSLVPRLRDGVKTQTKPVKGKKDKTFKGKEHDISVEMTTDDDDTSDKTSQVFIRRGRSADKGGRRPPSATRQSWIDQSLPS